MNDYSIGLEILKKIYSYTKTSYTFEQFLDGLSRSWDGVKMSDSDFKDYVSGLAKTKKLFLGIPWKSSSDWEKAMKEIATKVPAGKFPDKKTIDSYFLNPQSTKPSFFDYGELILKAGGEAAKKGVQIGAIALSGLAIAKIIGAGLATYVLIKQLGSKKLGSRS